MSAFRRRPSPLPGPGLTAILVALVAILLALMLSVATAGADDPDAALREGRRVRVQATSGERYEGVLAAHDDGGLRMWCGNGPRPVLVPRHEIVFVEVYTRPPTRLDVYMGIGAFIGLGVGLLIDLQGASQQPCDGDPFECDSWDFDVGPGVAIIALPLLGAGLGALIGLAHEGEEAWQPVGVRWSAAEAIPQLYLAQRF